jgi:hypothetical protein
VTFSRGIFKKQAVVAAAVALWLQAVVFGFRMLWQYSATPGHPASPPISWPKRAPFERRNGKATLVMFVHPQCPCSRASLGELAIIAAHSQEHLDAVIFFYRPAKRASDWARTDLWQTAAHINNVRAFEDPDAQAAQTFGAFTSGQTLLYGSDGKLLFKGGITASRGHSGDNAGRRVIGALLNGEAIAQNRLPIITPVFGCSLQGE